MTGREAAVTALIATLTSALTGAVGVKSVLRGAQLPSAFDPSAQPVVCVGSAKQKPAYSADNLPARWSIDLDVFAYVHRQSIDPATALGTTLNAILDAIDTALGMPAYGGRQTLGGVVEHVELGDIDVDEGGITGQAFAIIPLTLYMA